MDHLGEESLVTQSSWIREARSLLQHADTDFFRVNPWRYWCDFVLSVVLAYTAIGIYVTAPPGSWIQLAAFPFAIFWLYRLGSLVHEVCHLGQHEMRFFKVAWNLVVGVMTLAPSPFFTRHHRDHHTQRMYGTPQDPEYVVHVFRPGSLPSILFYGLIIAVYPLLVFLRFFLAPLTFLHPRLRQWTLTRASALTMNWRYERKLNDYDRRAFVALELLCWLRATLIPVAALIGLGPWYRPLLYYSLALGVLILNQMRQLADHHFEKPGQSIDLDEHIRDSCNFTGCDPLTWLFFPFSIRYHALHHLFPSLPYHNLAAAHYYLVKHVSPDSPYRELDQSAWWPVARKTLFGKAAA
jgi:fatty acid desaturase